MRHDLYHHAALLEARHDARARCSVTGLSAHTLWKVFDKLTVDRLDPSIGYVAGNCRLLAGSLNTARGIQDKIPHGALKRLWRKVEKVVASIHDRKDLQGLQEELHRRRRGLAALQPMSPQAAGG